MGTHPTRRALPRGRDPLGSHGPAGFLLGFLFRTTRFLERQPTS